MTDENDALGPEMLEQARQIEDVIENGVVTADSPGAVAVAAQVGRDDVISITQLLGYEIPAARVISPAVEQHQQGRFAVTVVDVVESEPLGEEAVRGGAGLIGQVSKRPGRVRPLPSDSQVLSRLRAITMRWTCEVPS